MLSEDRSTPRKLRNQAALQVKQLVAADEVCFCTFALVDGVNHYTSFAGALSPDTQRTMEQLEGRASLGERLWLPSMTPVEQRNRFQRLDYDIEALQKCKEPFLQKLCAPLEITRSCRVRLYERDRFLGFIICARRGPDAKTFSEQDLERLNAFTGELKAEILRAERLELDLPSPAYAIFDAERRLIEWASDGVHPWFDERRIDHLQDILAQPALPPFVVLDSRVLHLSQLSGSAGSRTLVKISAGDDPRLAPHADLTPTQCEVADFAVVGATNPEIARHLGISTETVKTHIKNIYGRLGVSSRLELSQLLAS